MTPGAAEALTLHRKTGELHRLRDDDAAELLGHLPARAVRAITTRLPYAPGVVLLALIHGYPPALFLLPDDLAVAPKRLPEDVAGPVLAVVAYSVLARGKA